MKFTSVLAIFSLASSAFGTATLTVRDAAGTITDIQTLSSQLATLRTDVDNFQGGNESGGTQKVVKIQQDASAIDKTLRSAGLNAQNSANFDATGSANVANAVVGLQPQIYGVLTALINKRNGFATLPSGAAISNAVKNQIITLRTDTAYFGANVTNRLVPALAKAAPLLTSNIDFKFSRAQDSFSS